ncbi:MAG: TonB-dependent receptor [Bacteroidetes bacterium]|nr:TonB-dependent receptor [Bacteroidota bacterium]
MRKLTIACCLCSTCIWAQKKDTTHLLEEVSIITYKPMNGIGRMKDEAGQIIYAGKKTELLLIDSLDANKALNNTRQIIGRIPGLNIVETESGGFTANGIGFRGVNPYQGIEMNTRQNGYNISADAIGYNEAYYLPPMEAVKNISFVRGAASLAFGPQIGGMVNYELKDAANKPIEATVSQTMGNYNMSNSFLSLGGTLKKFKYYGYVQYRYFGGWRDNSQQSQLSGFASLKYQATNKLQVGLEYSALRNTIRMPGGLTDSLFQQNPMQSLRSRNWLQSPWNIVAFNLNYQLNENTSIGLKSAFLYSERDLVWKNEDGGPGIKDSITPDLQYVPREVEHEKFRSITNELRVLTHYYISGKKQSLAFGVRYAYAYKKNQHGADGTTGSDLTYVTTSPWGGNTNYYTNNLAPFIENTFYIGKRFSITPGLRFEYIHVLANGYDEDQDPNPPSPYVVINNLQNTKMFLLPGVGLQYKVSENTGLYANYTQSYRPITYAQLTPFGTIAKINPNLKDANADNVDIGYRGSIKNIINFDIGAFFINYKNRIGTIYKYDTALYAYRTNIGTSQHIGAETYVEVNILDGLIPTAKYGRLSIYNSYAYIHAQYISGAYAGNQVEYAPRNIERVGLNYKIGGFSFNMQYSYTSLSYGDASNSKLASDALSTSLNEYAALAGIIPAYQVVDVSGSYKLKQKYQFKFGVTNLMNEKYFTIRTSEYPGPGIIPSPPRMFYIGFSTTF